MFDPIRFGDLKTRPSQTSITELPEGSILHLENERLSSIRQIELLYPNETLLLIQFLLSFLYCIPAGEGFHDLA